MATVIVTNCNCDHCGKAGAVPRLFRSLTPAVGERLETVIMEATPDLCAKCYERTDKFIHRGLNPPSKGEIRELANAK